MTDSPPLSSTARWTSRILTGLVALNMLWSAGIKLAAPQGIPEHFAQLGWSMPVITGVAGVELVCALFYLVPPTRVLGALLLTAYLGGATAAHVRLGEWVALYPMVLGVMAWAGLWVQEPRLRALVPLRR